MKLYRILVLSSPRPSIASAFDRGPMTLEAARQALHDGLADPDQQWSEPPEHPLKQAVILARVLQLKPGACITYRQVNFWIVEAPSA